MGNTLTADTSNITDPDGLTNVQATPTSGSRVDADGVSNPTNIGSNSSTYTLVAGDAGKKIKVKVTFTDDASNSETLTSEPYPSGSDTVEPGITVSFEQASYTVAEGSSVAVKVSLNADPERTVTIPITRANQGGASNSDYSGVPASLTFNGGDTEQTITFAAAADSDNDDGESVKLGFGTLPTGVTAGSTNEATVSITGTDNGETTAGTVPDDWPLIPTGLGVGDSFRLLFLTSTKRNITNSIDIGDYNTFVQNRAAAGHADIQDYSSLFKVVGSTAAVDARDNTGTTYTNTDLGVPIYWLGGNKVADHYRDFPTTRPGTTRPTTRTNPARTDPTPPWKATTPPLAVTTTAPRPSS